MVDLKRQVQKSNQNAGHNIFDSTSKEKRKQRWGYRPEEKKKDPDEIPVLKYGPSNNFM
jgi:hypothetical protein